MLSTAILTCSVVVFLYSVRIYYSHLQPLHALTTSREYHNVYALNPSTTLPDASVLNFVSNAKVDASRTVSLKSLDTGVNTFCAAPVVDNTNSAKFGRVEFVAVGTNCCGK